MSIIAIKAELENELSAILTKRRDHHFNVSNSVGSFDCKVSPYSEFLSVRRQFFNGAHPVSIPFTADRPGLVMMFTLEGKSAFYDRHNPYLQLPLRHSLSYFNEYDCTNLLDIKGTQNDITFSLSEQFYKTFMVESTIMPGNRLFENILQRKTMNMINNHLPMDSGISGILQNIIHCPYKDDVREMYLRENLRALMFLQLFHFHSIATGKDLSIDKKLTSKDQETLHAIKEYLSIKFLEPTSLEGLAKRFGLNEFKIKYGFKKMFNTSPIRFTQQKRLELSLLLLRDTSSTIDEIASKVGYNHATNFSIAFRKAFGKSPQNFR